MKEKGGRESKAHPMDEQRERRGTMRFGLKKKERKGIQGACSGGAMSTRGYNEVRVEEKRWEENPGRMGWRNKENEGVQ